MRLSFIVLSLLAAIIALLYFVRIPNIAVLCLPGYRM